MSKRTDEHTRTFMYGQKNKRTYSILCHYVLMSKRTDEQAQTFMCRQKKRLKLMSLWTYVKRPCTYKFVNCFQISMASRPPAKKKRLNDVPNRNGIL